MPLDSSAVNAFANAMAQKNAGARQDKAALMGGIMDLGQGLIAGQDKLAMKKQKEKKENAAKEKIRAALSEYKLDPNIVELGPRAAIEAILEAKKQAFETTQLEGKRTRNVGQSKAIMGALGVENPPEIDDVDTAYNVGNALAKQRAEGEKQTQLGSLLKPNASTTMQMPNLGALGMPMMPKTLPTSIPEMPATPRQVMMRAGSMGKMDPEILKAALEGSTTAYPRPKEFAPRGTDRFSPEAVQADIAREKGKVEAQQPNRDASMEQLEARLAVQREIAEADRAARMEIEKLRMSNDPNSRRDALMALQARRSGLPAMIAKGRQSIPWIKDPVEKKKAEDAVATAERTMADVDLQLQQFQTQAPPAPAPQGAPSGGGSDPTPAELAEMDAAGMRWDAATRSVVPK